MGSGGTVCFRGGLFQRRALPGFGLTLIFQRIPAGTVRLCLPERGAAFGLRGVQGGSLFGQNAGHEGKSQLHRPVRRGEPLR